MTAKLYGAVILTILVMIHPKLTLTSGGLSIGLPAAALIAASVFAACVVLALLIVRALQAASCPRFRSSPAST